MPPAAGITMIVCNKFSAGNPTNDHGVYDFGCIFFTAVDDNLLMMEIASATGGTRKHVIYAVS